MRFPLEFCIHVTGVLELGLIMGGPFLEIVFGLFVGGLGLNC